MVLVEERPRSEYLGGIGLSEEFEVGEIVSLTAGMMDAELGGELVVDVYDGDDGASA